MTKMAWRLQEPPPSQQMMDSMERMIKNHKQRELERKGKKESKEDDLPEDLETYEQLLTKRIDELRDQKTKLFLLMKEVLKHDDEKKKRQMQKEIEQRQKLHQHQHQHHHQHHGPHTPSKPSLLPSSSSASASSASSAHPKESLQPQVHKPPPPPLQIAERTLSSGSRIASSRQYSDSSDKRTPDRPSPSPTLIRDISPKKRARSPEPDRTEASRRRYDDKPSAPSGPSSLLQSPPAITTPVRSLQPPPMSNSPAQITPTRSQPSYSAPIGRSEPEIKVSTYSAPPPPLLAPSASQQAAPAPARPSTSQYYPQYLPQTATVPQQYTVFQYGQGSGSSASGGIPSEPIKITTSSYSTAPPKPADSKPATERTTQLRPLHLQIHSQSQSSPSTREDSKDSPVNKKWKPLSEFSAVEPEKGEQKIKSVLELLVQNRESSGTPEPSQFRPSLPSGFPPLPGETVHVSLLEDAVENLTPEDSPLPEVSNPPLPEISHPPPHQAIAPAALLERLSPLAQQQQQQQQQPPPMSNVSPISPTHSSPPRRGSLGKASTSPPQPAPIFLPPSDSKPPAATQEGSGEEAAASEPGAEKGDETSTEKGEEPSLQQRQYQQYQQYQQYSQLSFQQYPAYQQYGQFQQYNFPYGYQQFNFQQYPGFTPTFQQYASPAKGATPSTTTAATATTPTATKDSASKDKKE